MCEPSDNPFVNPETTDHHRKDTMHDYDWMAPLPASAPADVRFWIETLAEYLGTDGAAEQMDEMGAVASEAASYESGPSPLAQLACGWLSTGQSLETLAEIHAFSLAVMAIAQDAGSHLTATDAVTRAVLPFIAAPDALDVVGEISAGCVELATLAGTSDREIAEWVITWQTSGIGRTVLTRIAALFSLLADVADEITADESGSGAAEGAEI
jgi:hypothetical protein